MPVYNGARFLEEAIDSILAQTFTDFELVIVDDGSSDATPAILASKALQDPRVRVIRQENAGIVAALNNALTHCRSRHVARMDADDVALPDRFAFQVRYLDEHPGCVLVGGCAFGINEQGTVLGVARGGRHRDTKLDTFPPKVSVSIHPLIMTRKAVLDRIGGYRARYPHAEDYDLYLRLSEFGTIDTPEKVVLKYRRHTGQVSVQHLEVQERAAAMAEVEAMSLRNAKSHRLAGETAEIHGQWVSRHYPSWLINPYVRFRQWRRLRSLNRDKAMRMLPEIIAYSISLRPRTLFSRKYFTLRLRILGSLAQYLLKAAT